LFAPVTVQVEDRAEVVDRVAIGDGNALTGDRCSRHGCAGLDIDRQPVLDARAVAVGGILIGDGPGASDGRVVDWRRGGALREGARGRQHQGRESESESVADLAQLESGHSICPPFPAVTERIVNRSVKNDNTNLA
jgi:hypothetical protein